MAERTGAEPSKTLSISRFDFFGQRIRVESDDPGVLSDLGTVYERQRIVAAGADAGPEILIRALRGTQRGAQVKLAERRIQVPEPAELSHYAHLVLLNVAAAAAEEVQVLHGGAVCKDGRAALWIGPSGAGKTTLTLALLARGWDFLTDDFVVLDAEGWVHPFPRRINLTDQSAELLGIEPPSDTPRLVSFGGLEKHMLDVETLYPGRLAAPARASALFILMPELPEPETQTDPESSEAPPAWLLTLDHVPQGFEAAVAQLPGVQALERSEESGPPQLKIELAPQARIVRQLDALCAERDVAVISARRADQAPLRFEDPPQVRAAALETALPRILSQDLGLSGRRFMRHAAGADPLAALGRLRGAIRASGAEIFDLVPGSPEQSAALIERTLES